MIDAPNRSDEPASYVSAAGPLPVRYVGLMTRGVAFAIDAAIINLVALVVSLGAALILSLLYVPGWLKDVLIVVGAVAYIAWAIGYFAGFWSTAGQTPGARMMRFRVVTSGGERLRPRRGIVRCVGLLLAALPLFAGYVMILLDQRRRGLQDRLARTVVIDAPASSIAEQRRARRRTLSDPNPPPSPSAVPDAEGHSSHLGDARVGRMLDR